MTTNTPTTPPLDSCPPEDELVPFASGEKARPDVEAHVESCALCQNRMRDLRDVLIDLRDVASTTTAHAKLPPRIDHPEAIGKYRVLSRLGAGGQAEVFRALHPMLERDVVIKLGRKPIAPGSPEKERIVEEGKLLAQLDHPGLARVLDLDFHDGYPFLVMDFLPGRSLAQVARDERIAPERAARMVASMARSLESAHRRGIVHRDLKPSNVLIGEDDAPRVIDFGIALIRTPWSEEALGEADVSGTAEYMAPEQARGEAARVGPRSDVFALGGILYFLFTGKAPFTGRSIGACLKNARECVFDDAALESSGASRALLGVCRKAMSPDPDDRFARAEDVALALDRAVRRPVVLRRARLASVAAILLAGLGWLAWTLWPATSTPQRRASEGTILSSGEVPFQVEEASLWRHSVLQPERLFESSPIEEGDELFLRLKTDKPIYAYVLNEDENGHRSRLFPRGELDQKNPLDSSSTHELPGTVGGDRKGWSVVSRGGKDSLFIALSVTPIEALERNDSLDSLEHEAGAQAVQRILRGIDGLSDIDAEKVAKGKDLLARVVHELKRTGERGEARGGPWVRKITLRNP